MNLDVMALEISCLATYIENIHYRDDFVPLTPRLNDSCWVAVADLYTEELRLMHTFPFALSVCQLPHVPLNISVAASNVEREVHKLPRPLSIRHYVFEGRKANYWREVIVAEERLPLLGRSRRR